MSQQRGFTSSWPYQPAPSFRRIGKVALARREEALRRAPFFADLPKRHLRSIARFTTETGYKEGAVVVKEGTIGSAFYVILDGRAKVVRGTRTIARLAPGDFFGEISLLDGGPRMASVVAQTPLRVLDLAGKDFRDLLAGEPTLTLRILAVVAQRLRGRERPLVG